MESAWGDVIGGALCSLVVSLVGFIAYLKSRTRTSDQERKEMISLLMGLAQHQVLFKGLEYIERGWVTSDEYEDLRRYLYDPYKRLGGNGAAERIMHAVERLPFHAAEPTVQRAFAIPIRETDATGLPQGGKNDRYIGDERRDL